MNPKEHRAVITCVLAYLLGSGARVSARDNTRYHPQTNPPDTHERLERAALFMREKVA